MSLRQQTLKNMKKEVVLFNNERSTSPRSVVKIRSTSPTLRCIKQDVAFTETRIEQYVVKSR